MIFTPFLKRFLSWVRHLTASNANLVTNRQQTRREKELFR